MVEQLGLAMILSEAVNLLAFISGMINFLEESIRQSDELSITTAPESANFGAHYNDIDPPAENKAISGLLETAVSKPTTLWDLPPQKTFFPTDFFEATGINSVYGKFLSDRTWSITSPTIPVAPTTANFISLN